VPSRWASIVPGGEARALLCRPEILVVEWRFQAGSQVGAHSHPELQVTICLEGRAELVINGEKHTLKPGNYTLIHPGEPHSAYFPEDTKLIDVFIPSRESLAKTLCPQHSRSGG
jgi:quercetin dioxygenase-like cupin family protein